ncbi:MAG: DMT family transporter [Aestuariivirga sp.]|uniref:DMT family transporter n=1 Tax=Aestuariivirga sp. TaxID=2650926 RepID=UPI0025C558D0|nr:DMT family transporter [Aestuariivirga sp.]MCA3561051.1 DMT family transporter [Aestuariivirga sp.]
MELRAFAAMMFTIVIWGIGPVFLRSLSVELGPADHLVIRYTIVTVIYAFSLAIFGGWRIERKDWPRLLVISLIGMMGYNLGSAFGFAHVTAGIGSLIIGTQPLLIALMGTLIAKERLTLAAIAGLIIGFLGIVLLVWHDLGSSTDGWGFLAGCTLIFLSGAAWAVYVIVSKPLIRKYGAFSISAMSLSLCSLAMVPMLARPSTLTTLTNMTARSWLELGYIAIISTMLCSVTWNYAASRMRAAASGAFLYLIPIIGVAAGAVILSEHVTSGMVMGGALILIGVAIAQFGGRLRLGGSLAALAAVLFAVTMWGLIPVAMRYLITELSPQTAMVLRLYPAGVLAIIVCIFTGVRPIAWRDWGRIAIAALAGNLGYQILAAFGMQSVPASWTGLLFGLEPVFIALFAVVLAGDRLTAWLIGGIFVSMLGTAALMLGSTLSPSGDVSLFGLVLVTLSTMGWGIYTVVIRPATLKYGALPVSCLAMAITALPMPFFVSPGLPLTLASMTGASWLAVGFVVVFGTFLATAAWNYALGAMDSSIAGVFLYVQPVVAAIGGILLLGERLTWPLLLGGALIVLGVAIAQFGPLITRRVAAIGNSRLRGAREPVMETP